MGKSIKKMSKKEAEARIRVYEEAIGHLERGDCYDDTTEEKQAVFVINEIKKLAKKFEHQFYFGKLMHC